MVKEEYILENLCCADCALKIEAQVNKLPEVQNAHVDFINKKLSITTVKEQVLEHNIRRIVRNIEPDVSVRQVSHLAITPPPPIPISLYLAGIAVLLLVLNLLLKPPGKIQLSLFIIAYLLSGWKVLFNALVKALKGLLLDEHFLMSIASLGAIYLGEFPEAIAVMVLYEIGQFFENKAVNRSRDSIRNMLELKPEIVHRLITDKTDDIPVTEVVLGEKIVVLPGERIALDGIVIAGESSLDTSALTGEAVPLSVEKGQQVLSGTLNLSGKIVIEVTATDADSTVTRILKLVEEAAHRKSRTEQFITRFARKYTPAVVFLAICLALIPPVVFESPFHIWFKRSLIFLIVSCPCALIISIPLTNYAAIGAAARKGILMKGSNFLDALARAKTFVYDKTGTLTTGKLVIQEVLPLSGVSEEQLITAALTCEENSNHPLAMAVRQKYKGKFATKPSLMHQEFHGKGIRVQTPDSTLQAGSRAFLHDAGIKNLPAEPVETCIYIAENDQCLGLITFQDEIKDDFPEVLNKLRSYGIKKHIMLTGDHEIQAKKLASELKLNAYHARLLPDEKIRKLEIIEAKETKPIVFIGDGLNDAPVLTAAEIGIAMGAIGNQISIEAADIVLMQDEPYQLLTAVKMARKTNSILWQNIILALGIKVAVMVMGTMGLASLWEAVIADVGVTILAVANATRLVRI